VINGLLHDPGDDPTALAFTKRQAVALADAPERLAMLPIAGVDFVAGDVVVTMGCGDACPYIPGKRYIDWELPDPKGRPIKEVRATRDDIARRVQQLVTDLDQSTTS
jgi:protein-tyrosine-phosphatase